MDSLRSLSMIVVILFYVLDGTAVATNAPDYLIQGRVYCDTCRAGFETNVTEYIKGRTTLSAPCETRHIFPDEASIVERPPPCYLGAKVRLECRHFGTGYIEREVNGVTDETGTYKIELKDSHEEDICEVVLVESPLKNCAEVQAFRDRARVVLSQNLGISDNVRFANPLGYLKDVPLPICGDVLKLFDLSDDDE